MGLRESHLTIIIFAPVAQWKSIRLLSGLSQVQILLGVFFFLLLYCEMTATTFLESRIHDTNFLSRIEKFKANLPEEQREQFTDLITLAYLAGEERIHEMWAEDDAGEDL